MENCEDTPENKIWGKDFVAKLLFPYEAHQKKAVNVQELRDHFSQVLPTNLLENEPQKTKRCLEKLGLRSDGDWL